MKSRSRDIGSLDYSIALKFDKRLSSSAADVQAKLLHLNWDYRKIHTLRTIFIGNPACLIEFNEASLHGTDWITLSFKFL